MESVVKQVLAELPGELVKTGSPDFLFFALLTHWRSKKALPVGFQVVTLGGIEEGTKVCLTAGNDYNYGAELRDNTSFMKDNMAKF